MTRRLTRFVGYLLLAALAVAIVGCAAPGTKTSVQERIADFLSDLNNDAARTSIYKNLHPDIQNAWKSSTPWESSVFEYANKPFGLTSMTYGSNSASGTLTYLTSPGGDAISFVMKEDGSDNWCILSVTVGGLLVVH